MLKYNRCKKDQRMITTPTISKTLLKKNINILLDVILDACLET